MKRLIVAFVLLVCVACGDDDPVRTTEIIEGRTCIVCKTVGSISVDCENQS